MEHSRQSRSFSMTDALGVAIAGLFMLSLLFSYVAASKDTHTGNYCLNQMRQLALASLNKESATQRFPLAMYGATARDEISTVGPTAFGDDDGYSWIVSILPYCDEGALFDAIQKKSDGFQEPINSAKLKTLGGGWIQETRIPFLLCPAMPGDHLAKGKYGELSKPQISNYRALVAATVEPGNQRFADRSSLTGGIIVTKGCSPKGLKIGDVKDGSSKTLMLAESKAEMYSFWFSGRSVSTVAMPPDIVSSDDWGKLLGGAAQNVPSGLNYGRPYDSNQSKQPWFSTKYPPGNVDWGPSSHHPEGVAHAYVDGSVKFLSAKISPSVYCQLAARVGPETDAAKVAE